MGFIGLIFLGIAIYMCLGAFSGTKNCNRGLVTSLIVIALYLFKGKNASR